MLTSALQAKPEDILMVNLQMVSMTTTLTPPIHHLPLSSPKHSQYLGFLDLYLLSIHSAQRRKKVYSLNQSGEPEVWSVVHTASLSLINSLTTRLSAKKQPNGVVGVGAAAGVAGGGLTSSSPPVDLPKNMSKSVYIPRSVYLNHTFICVF